MNPRRESAHSLIACLFLLAVAAPWGAAAKESDFVFGVGTHHPAEADYFGLMRQAGVMATRDDYSWGRAEKEKGKIVVPPEWAAELQRTLDHGMKTICILDYANKFYDDGGYPRSPEAVEGFCRYAEAVVSALKDKVTYWQVWNEWDGGCGMAGKGRGDAESYVKLLAAVYPRIKKIHPESIVLANSVCTGDAFLLKTVELGALKSCDALSLHTYFYGDPQKTMENHWYPRMTNLDRVLREANGGKAFPLYATEIGFPTQTDPRGCTEDAAAENLSKLYLLAMGLPYVKGVWWYDFRDDGWDAKYNENNFGMVRRDLTPKLAYFAYRDIANAFRGARFVERVDVKDPLVWVMRYRKADGRQLLAAWTEYKDIDIQMKLAAPEAVAFELGQPGHGAVKRAFVKGAEGPATAELVLRNKPWVAEGALDGVKVVDLKKIEFRESSRPQKIEIRLPSGFGRAPSVASGAKAPVQAFGEESDYRRVAEAKRGGKADLDASYTMRWEKGRLLLSVLTTDDVFSQEYSGGDTWQGDGIQFALHAFTADAANVDHHDFDVALTKAGPMAYRQAGVGPLKPGPAPELKPLATRNGNQIRYEVEIPASAFGSAELRAGMGIGFSLLVNDNDGKGRKGYLRWGDGIGAGKDPSLYHVVVLEE
ncbi:MAG: hypothetical protein J0L75_15260 [Spirochaetes bacterium]|nr:hypothetical protein [Spirochaetota bacterium]